MNDSVYITLQQASEHLQAKGLMGQTPRVLRSAIARGSLAAAKDGRSWATTIAKLDEYENALWHVPSAEAVFGPTALRTPRRTAPTRSLSERHAAEASSRRLLALLAPAPAKRGRPLKREPRPPKPKREKKLTREEKEVAEFLARPAEEKKQRFRDYLDGKREHWRY